MNSKLFSEIGINCSSGHSFVLNVCKMNVCWMLLVHFSILFHFRFFVLRGVTGIEAWTKYEAILAPTLAARVALL